jgi:hypothetical protein
LAAISPGIFYDVNATTGAATNVRPTGISNLIGIAFGPGGVLYGLATTAAGQNVSLYTINPTSGASSLVGTSAPAAFNDAYGEGDIGYNPLRARYMALSTLTSRVDRLL